MAARGCAIAAAALTLLVTLVAGAISPGYSHAANYISELGVRGTTLGAWVSYAGFLPIGLLALSALILGLHGRAIEPALRGAAWWLMWLPVAYIVAAFARCAEGCAGVDAEQALHNLAGLGEYLGGGTALVIAGIASLARRKFLRGLGLLMLGLVVFCCLLAMFSPAMGGLHGAAQRVAEVILFGFLLFLVAGRVIT